MGWNADNEDSLGPTSTISELTLGAEYCFLVRRKRALQQRKMEDDHRERERGREHGDDDE